MVDLFRALACVAGSFWDYNFKGSLPMAAEQDALEAMAEHVAHSTGPECLPLLEGTLVCLMRVNHGEVSHLPCDISSWSHLGLPHLSGKLWYTKSSSAKGKESDACHSWKKAHRKVSILSYCAQISRYLLCPALGGLVYHLRA